MCVSKRKTALLFQLNYILKTSDVFFFPWQLSPHRTLEEKNQKQLATEGTPCSAFSFNLLVSLTYERTCESSSGSPLGNVGDGSDGMAKFCLMRLVCCVFDI